MSRLVETLNICEGFLPVNMATAANDGDWVSLKGYGHVAVVLFGAVGTQAESPTLTIEQATAVAGTGAKALNFTNIYKKQAATNLQAVNTWTLVTQAAANTYTETNVGDLAKLWVVEFDAEDLDVNGGFDCIRGRVADVGTGPELGALLYILSEPRHAVPESAIVN